MKQTYIVLLRGVNVSGANLLPTQEFARLLAEIGLKNVRTYIQTGNAVFQTEESNAAELPKEIRGAIQRSRGFAPDLILLTLEELEASVAANPYPEANVNPKSLHLTFLSAAPQAPDLEALQAVRKESERFALHGQVFYFLAPEGVGRSKLFAKVEKCLGVAGTARNWRTVHKILEMAQELAAVDAAT